MGKWRFEGSLLGHLCSEGWALRTSCCWPGSVGHCSSSNRKVRLVPIRLCPVSRPALLFNWRGPEEVAGAIAPPGPLSAQSISVRGSGWMWLHPRAQSLEAPSLLVVPPPLQPHVAALTFHGINL